MGISALAAFVAGVLVSNSFVTVATAAGFVSAQRRQFVYVGAGLLAAVFSLLIGLLFLFQAGGVLPDLGHYFRWLGGPNT
jgi:zinc transporter ZupT